MVTPTLEVLDAVSIVSLSHVGTVQPFLMPRLINDASMIPRSTSDREVSFSSLPTPKTVMNTRVQTAGEGQR